MQHLNPGATLQNGKYRIEHVLGQGGFGITYLAIQRGLERKVAIKEFFMKDYCIRQGETTIVDVIAESKQPDVQRLKNRFISEARTIAALEHPNIVHIHDVFEENETAYFVMEYLDGGDLLQVIKMQGKLPEEKALYYIKHVAEALKTVHAKNINHLDIKPANIVIRKETDTAVLIDFGLAKHYENTGDTSLSPVGISVGYAPLEQYSLNGVANFSPQTDIYALGATLYKLVTAQTPPSANEVFGQGLPVMSEVSNHVQKAIKYAMQARKEDRPQSVQDFENLLSASFTDYVSSEGERIFKHIITIVKNTLSSFQYRFMEFISLKRNSIIAVFFTISFVGLTICGYKLYSHVNTQYRACEEYGRLFVDKDYNAYFAGEPGCHGYYLGRVFEVDTIKHIAKVFVSNDCPKKESIFYPFTEKNAFTIEEVNDMINVLNAKTKSSGLSWSIMSKDEYIKLFELMTSAESQKYENGLSWERTDAFQTSVFGTLRDGNYWTGSEYNDEYQWYVNVYDNVSIQPYGANTKEQMVRLCITVDLNEKYLKKD